VRLHVDRRWSQAKAQHLRDQPMRKSLVGICPGFAVGRYKKNAGLKAVTLIATLNPVSQVLW
jgi:hypothetical protein